jgi:plastocyanin
MRLHGKTGFLPSIVLGVIVAVVLVGCGAAAYGSGGGSKPTSTPAAGGAGGSGSSVTIENFAFTPQTLTVKAGTTVTWTNKDGAPHTVTSADSLGTDAATTGLFDAQLGQGQSFSFTFSKPGTYFYECTIHKGMAPMHGEVVVN